MHLGSLGLDVHRTQLCTFMESIGGHGTVHLLRNRAHCRVIRTQHGPAIEGQTLQEVDEGLLQLPKIMAIRLHVVGIDIGHDGHGGLQVQKRSVRLIGFHHHAITATRTCVDTHAAQFAPNHKGRVQPGLYQHAADQAGGRRLAVRTCDGNATLATHQLRQHLCTLHYRQTTATGFLHFHVIRLNGSGNDHRLCAA